VGDGELREALRSQVAAAGCVTMAGFINQRDLPTVYAAGDILSVPSARDAHPLVVPEAMALGMPAVVSDRVGCIGASDHARPGVNCLVHRCGDIQGLCACIESLQADGSLRALLSKGARETARLQSPAVAAGLLADALGKVRERLLRYAAS
jgi:glycosyltransferase involved in cell wall biosynthesis